MKTVLHKADTRGFFDYSWLQTYHTFSFGNYHDPERVHFGRLRVLNDDKVAPGQGFGTHPHDNMEIVTIVLSGELAHKDSAGHEKTIGENEVQIMSAGTGIKHSEYNYSDTQPVSLLQIWVFPDAKGYEPRYDQKWFDPEQRKNNLQLLVAPEGQDSALWLHQQTYFSRAEFTQDTSLDYSLQAQDFGLYVFMIKGRAEVAGQLLKARDGLGVWDTKSVTVNAEPDTDILFIQVPMH